MAAPRYRLYDVAPDVRFLVAEPGDAAPGNSEVILVQNFFEELKRMVGRWHVPRRRTPRA